MRHFLYMDIQTRNSKSRGRGVYHYENAILCDGVKDFFALLSMVATEEKDHVHLEYRYNEVDREGNATPRNGTLDVPFEESRYLEFKAYDFLDKTYVESYFVFQPRPLTNAQAIWAFNGHHIDPEERIRFHALSNNKDAIEAEEERAALASVPPLAPLGSGTDPDLMKDYVEEHARKYLASKKKK
ncbi:MAG: hypothetical protein K6E59_06510 [Bacilli bacterium]|nr:hypothetical protein [Bacilli bacterium]